MNADTRHLVQDCDGKKPLRAADLFCGLGGWTEGLLSEGYHCTGYDIEAQYGDEKYPGDLVLADVANLHGSELAYADLIVASPPCQEFSYMAMPWSRAKQIARALRGEDAFPEPYRGSRTVGELTALFDACFRIQREASEAAGRYIPMVVENVKGAQPWVGSARWNFGSYFLWGDVPALMPRTLSRESVKNPGLNWSAHNEPDYRTSGKGACFRDSAIKNRGGSWFNIAHNPTSGVSNNPDGRKNPGFRFDGSGRSFQTESVNRNVEDCFGWSKSSDLRNNNSKSSARKAASAKIAKIPFALSAWIGRTYKPQARAA